MASLRLESFLTNPLALLFEYVPSIKYVAVFFPVIIINHIKNIIFFV